MDSDQPSAMNPSDFMLTLVNADFSRPETVNSILDNWDERSKKLGGEETAFTGSDKVATKPSPKNAKSGDNANAESAISEWLHSGDSKADQISGMAQAKVKKI
jgi:hypothetical protein